MNQTTITYNDKCVRWFTWASIIWGVVAMLVGLIVSLQLNITMMPGVSWIEFLSGGTLDEQGLPYLTLGRIRPVHTNAAIFAFVGNMIFAGVYYSTQRL
jgi:cytochrome c oxidase cbb3-type subunit I/II